MADALPTIGLPAPQVLLRLTESVDPWFDSAGVALNWATVIQAFATSDKTIAGQVVLLDISKATPIRYSAVVYYLANEDDLGASQIP